MRFQSEVFRLQFEGGWLGAAQRNQKAAAPIWVCVFAGHAYIIPVIPGCPKEMLQCGIASVNKSLSSRFRCEFGHSSLFMTSVKPAHRRYLSLS